MKKDTGIEVLKLLVQDRCNGNLTDEGFNDNSTTISYIQCLFGITDEEYEQIYIDFLCLEQDDMKYGKDDLFKLFDDD